MHNLFKDWSFAVMNLSAGEVGTIALIVGVVFCTVMYFNTNNDK